MSRNLHLTSRTGGSIELYQTPTSWTNQAMRLYDTGCSGEAAAAHAAKVYEQFLVEDMKLEPDEVHAIIVKINAFLAFAPGAHFTGY